MIISIHRAIWMSELKTYAAFWEVIELGRGHDSEGSSNSDGGELHFACLEFGGFLLERV